MIPPKLKILGPTLGFIQNTLLQQDLCAADRVTLLDVVSSVLRQLVEKNEGAYNVVNTGGVEIGFGPCESGLQIEIANRGCPLFLPDLILKPQTADASPIEVRFENQGRKGQSIFITIESSSLHHTPMQQKERVPEDYRVRFARADETHAISRLFYQVYRYRYVNEDVYHPERLAEMLRDGRLTSVIGETLGGAIVGHVGLIRWQTDPPVYEAAMGVVDPTFASNGLFSKIFSRVMELTQQTPMQYCIYDLVTNHDYSQRQVAKYGFCELALFLGNQVAETQARLSDLGIGKDSTEMDRYSLLVGVGPRVVHPFGKQIVLPVNIGEACDFLLKPLGLSWVPSPRFYPLPSEGDFKIVLQPEQKAVLFDFVQPGRRALNRLLESWQQYLTEGVQYAAVDLPLEGPGMGQLYDILARHGFFMAGFIPYHQSDRLGFRFQFLTPTKVDFRGIKMFSPTAKRLLQMVENNYNRNRVL